MMVDSPRFSAFYHVNFIVVISVPWKDKKSRVWMHPEAVERVSWLFASYDVQRVRIDIHVNAVTLSVLGSGSICNMFRPQ